ncbi:hypothetical protein YTPLAS21_12230 [Candidatus Nitrosocosmicus sp.]|nr:hypothetical protein YTPLAS21_12160 [Candidatus Nitrosocosmicus sp.]GKS61765.1 hypothetical protein YTPLAS21_12230 [Candidatus Nitrosocosmicus sp.]
MVSVVKLGISEPLVQNELEFSCENENLTEVRKKTVDSVNTPRKTTKHSLEIEFIITNFFVI